MHKTLESVLARGESLEDLVKRSQDLSVSTKFFYKDAKKLNKCPCVVM
jgi:synaptobrevin family protein YKT6